MESRILVQILSIVVGKWNRIFVFVECGSTTMIGFISMLLSMHFICVYFDFVSEDAHIYYALLCFYCFWIKRIEQTGIVELLLLQISQLCNCISKLFINNNDGLICFGWSKYRKTRREWFIFSKALVFRSYNMHTFIYCWQIATCISYELNYCYSTICCSFCRV